MLHAPKLTMFTTLTCTLVFRVLFCRYDNFPVTLPLSAHMNARMCSCRMLVAKVHVTVKCLPDTHAHRYRNGCPTQPVCASDGFNKGSYHGYVVVKSCRTPANITCAHIYRTKKFYRETLSILLLLRATKKDASSFTLQANSS